jgi:hypothetical protein
MEIYPEDFWMTFKKSWAPQPGWLSPEVAQHASRQPPVHAAATSRRPNGCNDEALGAPNIEGDDTGSSNGGKDGPVLVERRKKKPAACASGTSRIGCAPQVRRLEVNRPARSLRGRCVPGQVNDALPDIGKRTRQMNQENVVVLRPRLRDYTYADYLLSALRSMFEAQAAGQKELLAARIKLVSHLLEDIGRRRAD